MAAQHAFSSGAAIAAAAYILAEAPALSAASQLRAATGHPLHGVPPPGRVPTLEDHELHPLVVQFAPPPSGRLPTLQEHELHPLLVRSATLLLYGLTFSIGLAAVVLLVNCIYDAALLWCHRAHFHSCQRKVQHVHEVFLKRNGELPLCPYCIEPLSNQPSPSKVIFLCGHRFHTDCANKWFQENHRKAGRCPICEVARDQQASRGGAGAAAAEVARLSPGDCSSDEAQSFILDSLHRRYPEIIPEACVERWASCHTELWLSELTCPRYHSILKTQVK